MERVIRKAIRKAKTIYPLCITLNSAIRVAETERGRFVLKERPPHQFATEYKILSLLKRIRFPYIPPFYGLIRLEGRECMVQKYIEGVKLEEDKKLFCVHLSSIARVVAELHSIRKSVKKDCISFVKQEITQAEQLFETASVSCARSGGRDLIGHVLRLKPYIKFISTIGQTFQGCLHQRIVPSLINREVEFIVTAQNKIYLLDWEQAEFGDYAYDIADIHYVFPAMDVQDFIDTYKKHACISDNVELRVLVYLFIILLKESLYYVLDLNCLDFYRKFPRRILTVISKAALENKMKRIEDVYRRLDSPRHP